MRHETGIIEGIAERLKKVEEGIAELKEKADAEPDYDKEASAIQELEDKLAKANSEINGLEEENEELRERIKVSLDLLNRAELYLQKAILSNGGLPEYLCSLRSDITAFRFAPAEKELAQAFARERAKVT